MGGKPVRTKAMSNPDDLFEMYRTDRGRGAALKTDALAAALADNVRRTFATMDRLVAEVGQALAQARFTIKLASAVVDRSSYVRLDRTSENFRDYLKLWSHRRAESGSGGMHWEASITVTDHWRQSAEIGLGVAIEWPNGEGGDLAFVEFWTNGQGMTLPGDERNFQRALVSSIVRLEDAGTIKSAKPRA